MVFISGIYRVFRAGYAGSWFGDTVPPAGALDLANALLDNLDNAPLGARGANVVHILDDGTRLDLRLDVRMPYNLNSIRDMNLIDGN